MATAKDRKTTGSAVSSSAARLGTAHQLTPQAADGQARSSVSTARRTSDPARAALEVDLESLPFDPQDERLHTTWSTGAPVVVCLNSYPNGITFSIHSNHYNSGPLNSVPLNSGEGNSGIQTGSADPADGDEAAGERRFHAGQFHLRLKDTRDYQLPHGKYFLHKENYRGCLEHHLAKLHKRGLLESAVLYLGTTADPFAAFHKRFDVTTACLQLIEQYRPARLVVQTRSPMVIAALPTFKLFGERAIAVLPIESPLEKAILRYTPGQTRISERLVAAGGLRRQGVAVNLCVSPLLPYGDIARDAWDFALLLDRHSDYISVGCLASGAPADEKQLRALPIAQRLAADKNFCWLRPHAYRHLFQALNIVAPEKLQVPAWSSAKNSQLALFAA